MPLNKAFRVASFAFVATAALGACMAGVNGSVHVRSGETRDRATTVNGGVEVGDNAKVGEASTVNGGIRIGQHVTADSVETVNGGVQILNDSRISKDVVTVNGGIDLLSGVDVGGTVRNINGSIRLVDADVGGDITTVNGDVEVGANSHVRGGIHVREPHGHDRPRDRIPRVVIGPGAEVQGRLKFDREVKLYVSDTAKIGAIEGATPVPFSGNSPRDGGG